MLSLGDGPVAQVAELALPVSICIAMWTWLIKYQSHLLLERVQNVRDFSSFVWSHAVLPPATFIYDTSSTVFASFHDQVADWLDTRLDHDAHTTLVPLQGTVTVDGSALTPTGEAVQFIIEITASEHVKFTFDAVHVEDPATFTVINGLTSSADAAVSPMAGPYGSSSSSDDFDSDFDGKDFNLVDHLNAWIFACLATLKAFKHKAKRFLLRIKKQIITLYMDTIHSDDVVRSLVLFSAIGNLVLTVQYLVRTVLRSVFRFLVPLAARALLPLLEPVVGYLRASIEPSASRTVEHQAIEAPVPRVADLPATPAIANTPTLTEKDGVPESPSISSALFPAATSPAPTQAPAALASTSILFDNVRVPESPLSTATSPAEPNVPATSLHAAKPAAESVSWPDSTSDAVAAEIMAKVVFASGSCDALTNHVNSYKLNNHTGIVSEPLISRPGMPISVSPRHFSESFLDFLTDPISASPSEETRDDMSPSDIPLPSFATSPGVDPPQSQDKADLTMSHITTKGFTLSPIPLERTYSQSSGSDKNFATSSAPSPHVFMASLPVDEDVKAEDTAATEPSPLVDPPEGPAEVKDVPPPISPYAPWDKRVPKPSVKDAVPDWFVPARPEAPRAPAFRGSALFGDNYSGSCMWNDAEPAEMPEPTESHPSHSRGGSASTKKGTKGNTEPATSSSKGAFSFDDSLYVFPPLPYSLNCSPMAAQSSDAPPPAYPTEGSFSSGPGEDELETEQDDMDHVEQMMSSLSISPPLVEAASFPSLSSCSDPPKTSVPPTPRQASPRYKSPKLAIQAILSPIRTTVELPETTQGDVDRPVTAIPRCSNPSSVGHETSDKPCDCSLTTRPPSAFGQEEENEAGPSSMPEPNAHELASCSSLGSVSPIDWAEELAVDTASGMRGWNGAAALPQGKGKGKQVEGASKSQSRWDHSDLPSVGKEVPAKSTLFKSPLSISRKHGLARAEAPDSGVSMTPLHGSAEDWLARINSFKGKPQATSPQSDAGNKKASSVISDCEAESRPAPSPRPPAASQHGSVEEGWSTVGKRRRRR